MLAAMVTVVQMLQDELKPSLVFGYILENKWLIFFKLLAILIFQLDILLIIHLLDSLRPYDLNYTYCHIMTKALLVKGSSIYYFINLDDIIYGLSLR